MPAEFSRFPWPRSAARIAFTVFVLGIFTSNGRAFSAATNHRGDHDSNFLEIHLYLTDRTSGQARSAASESGGGSPELNGAGSQASTTRGSILAETDRAKGSGEIGAVLRREGLYSSHSTKWPREREDGITDGLTPQKRGPNPKPVL